MNLAPPSLPDIALPFAVPEMMHPAIVHFAVALPVVILILELVNLALRRRTIGSISFFFLLVMVLVYLGAYLTGTTDAQRAKDLISPETKTLLEAHKNGGIWLLYGSLGVLLLKLITAFVDRAVVRIVFLLMLGFFFWGTTGVVQKGCALTYKHGVNVKTTHASAAIQTTDTAGHASDKPTPKASESEATEKKKQSLTEKAAEVTHKATKAVKEKAAEVLDKAKEAIAPASKPAQEQPAEPAPEQPAKPASPVIPVETPPAG